MAVQMPLQFLREEEMRFRPLCIEWRGHCSAQSCVKNS